jgi:hypothetical protein
VRTNEGLAKATLKHYYRARLLEPALWKKLLSGRFDFGAAAGSLLAQIRTVLGGKPRAATGTTDSAAPLPERMRASLQHFSGKVLFIYSGSDLTAKEFLDLVDSSPEWRQLLSAARVTQHHLDEADHTFSRRVWRDQVLGWTAAWIATETP